jgi:hypothetical protein
MRNKAYALKCATKLQLEVGQLGTFEYLYLVHATPQKGC